MDGRGCLFVWLCICVIGCGVLANVRSANEGHGSICRSNERFLSCGGCQKTCQDPAPDCKGVCRTGCYCNEDEVRNDTGHCVKLADCPPVAPAKLQSSEPRTTDLDCLADEEYRSCEPCNRTCDNPNPICPAQCARGCFCRDDLVRDKDGRCVKQEECSELRKNESSNLVKPLPLVYQMTCGPHQYYSSRQNCERTCSSTSLVCINNTGCFCEKGFFRAPDGQCVKMEDCPTAEVSYGAAHEPAIEDCSSDEIYLSCGWCEPSCWDPRPECPHGVCTRGCLCRPPLLRHHSGHCVRPSDCTPQKCPDPNEEYVCRYGCEARCDAKRCFSRPRRCVLGCHCRFGLYRNSLGKCVPFDHCQANHNTTEESSKFVVISQLEDDTESPKSVFGPIPQEFDLMPDVAKAESPVQDDTPKPYNDVISKAVKLYKEFINSPTHTYSMNMYVPRTVKGISARSNRDDSGINTKTGLKSNDIENSQFFVNQEDKPAKNANVKNYMNDLISAMKEMLPQPMNFTIINYPMWSSYVSN